MAASLISSLTTPTYAQIQPQRARDKSADSISSVGVVLLLVNGCQYLQKRDELHHIQNHSPIQFQYSNNNNNNNLILREETRIEL